MSALIGGKDTLIRPLYFINGIVSIGDNDTIGSGTQCVVIGAHSQNYSNSSVVVGNLNSLNPLSDFSLIAGTSIVIEGNLENSIAIGSTIHIGGGGSISSGNGNIAIGQSITITSATSNTQNIVLGNSSPTDGHQTVSIGNLNTILNDSSGIILLGQSCSVGSVGGGVTADNTLVGTENAILDGSSRCVLVGGFTGGGGNSVGIGSTGSFVIAHRATIGNTSPDNVILLYGTIGTGSSNCFVHNSAIGDNASSSLALHGAAIGSVGGTNAARNIAIGNTSTIADGSQGCVLLGGFNGNGSHIGTNSSDSIIIGALGVIDDASPYSIAVGYGAEAHGSQGLAMGRSAIVGATAELITNGVALGPNCAVHANNSFVVGIDSTVHLTHINSQAYGVSVHTTRASQAIFGSTGTPLSDFIVVRAGGVALFEFDDALAASNLDTSMKLYYKDSTGALVSKHVTVNGTTGALTVALS
jgi:hypothetical protein